MSALLIAAGTRLFAAVSLRRKANGTDVAISMSALQARIEVLEAELKECHPDSE